jgi:GntR family transcriptional regulator
MWVDGVCSGTIKCRRIGSRDAMKANASTRRSAGRLNRSLSIYRQIEAILREQIVSGEYASGDRLPTEAALSALYRVSRPTVRLALHGLETEGLVRSEQGRGTFVKMRPPVRMPDRRSFSIEELVEPASPMTVAIQRSGTIRGQSAVHELMKLSQGAELFYFVRIYSLRGRPIGGAKVHLPIAFGEKLRTKDLIVRNILRTIADRCHTNLGSSTLSIDAAVAEPRFAEMLRMRAGAPLISVRRTTRDRADVVVEHSQMLFRPDLCHFTAKHVFEAS